MTTPLTDTDWNKALHPDRWWAREAALARRDGEIDRTHRRWRKWGRWITESDIDYLRRLIEFPPAEVAECDIDYLRRLIDDDIDYPLWLCPTGRRRGPDLKAIRASRWDASNKGFWPGTFSGPAGRSALPLLPRPMPPLDHNISKRLGLCPTGHRRHPQSPGQNPEGLPVQHPAWEGLPECDRRVLPGCWEHDLPAAFVLEEALRKALDIPFKCHCHRAPDLDGLVGLGASWR